MSLSIPWSTRPISRLTGKLVTTIGSGRAMPPSDNSQPSGSHPEKEGRSEWAPKPLRVRDLLTRSRVWANCHASSKKSLLDQLAEQFHSDRPDLDEREIFQTLLRRERLGSTALGHGVALPHGRFPQLERPLGAFIRLAEATDFDAVDGEPVSLIFALLVPDEDNEQHLNLIARLARMLDDPNFRDELLQAPENALYDRLIARDEYITQL